MAKPLPVAIQEEIVMRYKAKTPAPVIARSLGLSTTGVCRVLKRNGVPIRSVTEQRTRHTLRHDALDVLTPDAAYWYGFLFADGTVHRRPSQTPEVAVTLTASDRGHLEKLRTFLGSTHAITNIGRQSYGAYTSRAACRYSVRSKQLADQLCDRGRYEQPLDSHLANSRDFWRGVVDGDGSVCVGEKPVLSLVGSAKMLSAFTIFIGKTVGYVSNVCPHRTIYQVRLTGAPARIAIRLLYAGAATALSRKGDAAAEIMQAAQLLVPGVGAAGGVVPTAPVVPVSAA